MHRVYVIPVKTTVFKMLSIASKIWLDLSALSAAVVVYQYSFSTRETANGEGAPDLQRYLALTAVNIKLEYQQTRLSKMSKLQTVWNRLSPYSLQLGEYRTTLIFTNSILVQNHYWPLFPSKSMVLDSVNTPLPHPSKSTSFCPCICTPVLFATW